MSSVAQDYMSTIDGDSNEAKTNEEGKWRIYLLLCIICVCLKYVYMCVRVCMELCCDGHSDQQ